METILQRIQDLALPLHMMSNEQNISRLSHLSKAYSGIEVSKAINMAREGLLWELCYSLYNHQKNKM